MARVIFATGSIIRARVTYADPDTGVVTDPATVSVVIRSPDATQTTYVYNTDDELVRESAGVYHVLIELSQTGTYRWKWTGTATEQAVVDYDECDSERKF